MLPVALVSCAIAWWPLGRERRSATRLDRRSAAAGLAGAAALAALFYSSFLTFPAGVIEPFLGITTYLDRGVDPASHVQPWSYYVGLLAYSRSGGLRWSEGLVLALAVVGALTAWGLPRAASSEPERIFWARYLTCDVLIATAIFSSIPYKTPWNLLPFYIVAIVLAGIGFSALLHATSPRVLRGALVAAFVAASAHLGWQAWRASVTYASDPRNPYVYAHTVPDAVRLVTRIRELAAVHPDGVRMQVSVIAPPYEQWPLPWYLRAMPHVGYWTAPGDGLSLQAPVIVASTGNTAAIDNALGDRYVSEFFGLRPEVLLALYVERGLWDRFLARVAVRAPAAPAVLSCPDKRSERTWDPASAGLTDSRLARTAVRCGHAPAVALWLATSAP